MTGGIYLWKDGREVPDTMNVSMEHEEEMLFTWDSGFGNDQLGVDRRRAGRPTAPSRTRRSSIRYMPQKVNRQGRQRDGRRRRAPSRNAHMQNFLDCDPRPGKEPNCPFELGFRVSIACRMAVESYRQQRTVRWDAGQGRDRLEAARRGLRVHAGTDPAAQGGPGIRRSRDRAARHGVGRGADLPARSHPQTRQARLHGRHLPGRAGGAGLGYIEYSIIIEELSRVDGSVGIIVAAHTSLCSNHIYKMGSDEQRQRYLPKLAIGRVARLLVAHRARSRVGRRRHAHHGRAATTAAGCSTAPRPSPPTRTTPMSAWPWR